MVGIGRPVEDRIDLRSTGVGGRGASILTGSGAPISKNAPYATGHDALHGSIYLDRSGTGMIYIKTGTQRSGSLWMKLATASFPAWS